MKNTGYLKRKKYNSCQKKKQVNKPRPSQRSCRASLAGPADPSQLLEPLRGQERSERTRRMLDWRVFAVLAALCAFDGYSRFVAEKGEGAKGMSKEQAASVASIGVDDDSAVEEMGLNPLLMFKDHEPNRLHIQYCSS